MRTLSLVLLLFVAQCALSTEPSADEQQKVMDAVLAAAKQHPADLSLIPQGECTRFEDPATKERCWQAFRSYFDYYESGFSHRRAVFGWQHVSTRIIFVVVLLLVAAGIFFAWVQFRHDLIVSKNQLKGEAAVAHNLEISTAGLKVSSPVLGVIILALSLGFFYLYLVYVYPISEIL